MHLNTLGMWPIMWDHGHATMGYELVNETIDTSFYMMTKGMKSDGGLSASVSDLLKLVRSITNGEYISTTSLNTMLSPSSIGPFTVEYGLGVKLGEISGHKTWGHSGGYSGTGWAMLSHYPESNCTFVAASI